jgi:glutamine amidotransferase
VAFASCVSAGNITGVQFHPEKSHRYGMALLDSFAKAT